MNILKTSRLCALLILSCFESVSSAQTVELVCIGEIQTRLSGYTGTGKTNWTDDVKLEVTFFPKSNLVKRAFSKNLLLSICFFETSARIDCYCSVSDDNIACAFNDDELGLSSFSVNRKTAIAKVFQSSIRKNSDGMSTFKREESAEIPCQVFDKNKF